MEVKVDILLKKGFTLDQIYYNARLNLNHSNANAAIKQLAILGHKESQWVIDVANRNRKTNDDIFRSKWFLMEPVSGESLCFAALTTSDVTNYIYLLEQSANRGNAFAMALLENYNFAVNRYMDNMSRIEKTVECNDTLGLYLMGIYYQNKQETTKAVECYERSAQGGNQNAMAHCGDMSDDPFKRIHWYSQCIAMDGYPNCNLFFFDILNKFTKGHLESVSLVYALGKAVAFYISDTAWFNYHVKRKKTELINAMKLFQEWSTRAQRSVMTWLCIAKYHLKMPVFNERGSACEMVKFEKNVALKIAKYIWEARDTPENCRRLTLKNE